MTSCEQQLKVLNTEIERLRTEVARLEGVRDETTRGIDEVERQIAERGGPDAAKFKTELDERRMAFARLDENVQRSEEEVERLGERLQSLDPQIQLASKELAQLTGQEQTLSQTSGPGAEARSEAAAQRSVKRPGTRRNRRAS